MRLRSLVLALFVIPGLAAAQGSDPVAGAWEMVSNRNLTTGQAQPQQSPALRVVYANGHYAQFRAAANRAKIDVPREKMTRDQLFERGNIQGQFGTYLVAGTTMTRKILSAANPNIEGQEGTVEFRIQGDTMTVIATNAQGQKGEQVFRRLR